MARGYRQSSNRGERYIRLPQPTQLPLSQPTETALVIPTDEHLNLADMVHLILIICATALFLTDCFMFNPVTVAWPLEYRPYFSVGVYLAYSAICRYAVHAISISLKFRWHEQRPLAGAGVLEHLGWAALGRLVYRIWELLVMFNMLLDGDMAPCGKHCRFCHDPLDGIWGEEVDENTRLPGLAEPGNKPWVISLRETDFIDIRRPR
ncbi:hypothetical protein H072_5353 [Dactylellina haptotyla CBS 200.50]|uniref:Uncharacterized protein n=1 Tax=Dactylellina haptotyla (strain CBS 200.50) TaxID=1284197 RepID=S8ACW1_DACHA|nr:hypothetical protein H072_5353 [Dactylellina haptotyla CBS 200.50]